MKKKPQPLPHISTRLAPEYPRVARGWTGWLTHAEYDVLDMILRMGIDDLYKMRRDGVGASWCDRTFAKMNATGILEGGARKVAVTVHAKHLFRLTDQLMLETDAA